MTRRDYHQVMKTVGVADLKAHLSEHLRTVRRGESLTILDRREPVARLVPVEQQSAGISLRPSRLRLQDVRLPGPVGHLGDVLEDLAAERGERS